MDPAPSSAEFTSASLPYPRLPDSHMPRGGGGCQAPRGLFMSSEPFSALADLFLQKGCAALSALQG